MRGLLVVVVSASLRLAACLVVHPPPASALLRTTPVRMQYGGQQGYGQPMGGGQQMGGQQMGGYGQQMGGQQMGVQQMGGYGQQGGQALWRIYPVQGVTGHNKFSGAVSAVNQDRFRSVCEKYGTLPYTVIGNDERILCRWNMMMDPGTSVSRSQCKVSVYPDGTAVLTSNGSCSPTLVRSCTATECGMWSPLYQGQTYVLNSGDQIALDANNPEGAVFSCQNEGAMQQGGYGQQQGGYPQQGGYGGGY